MHEKLINEPDMESILDSPMGVCAQAYEKAIRKTLRETLGSKDTYVLIDEKTSREYLDLHNYEDLDFNIRLIRPTAGTIEPFAFQLERLTKHPHNQSFPLLAIFLEQPEHIYNIDAHQDMRRPLDAKSTDQIIKAITNGIPVNWKTSLFKKELLQKQQL